MDTFDDSGDTLGLTVAPAIWLVVGELDRHQERWTQLGVWVQLDTLTNASFADNKTGWLQSSVITVFVGIILV